MSTTPEYRLSPAQSPQAAIPKLAFSIDELAQALPASSRTIADWVKAGTAPPSFMIGRLRMFPVDAAHQWMRDRLREQAGDRPDPEAN